MQDPEQCGTQTKYKTWCVIYWASTCVLSASSFYVTLATHVMVTACLNQQCRTFTILQPKSLYSAVYRVFKSSVCGGIPHPGMCFKSTSNDWFARAESGSYHSDGTHYIIA